MVQTYSSLPTEIRPVQVNVVLESGRARIIITEPASIRIVDGPTRAQIAAFPSFGFPNRAADAGDIDRDGRVDLAVCDDSNLYIYDLLTGNARVQNGFGCREVVLGQTDSDPQLEIVLAGNPAGGFVLDGASLGVDWADSRGFGEHIAVADFDADGQDEVAALADAGTTVRVQDPATGALLWEIQTPAASALAAADMDSEPGAELVWATKSGYGSLFVVDGATPNQLRVIPSPTYSTEAVALGDLDHDGAVDVIWSSGRDSPEGQHVYLSTGDQSEYAAKTADLRDGIVGMAVGDFRGDGTPEIAATSARSKPGYGGIAFVLSLESGRLQRVKSEPFSGDWATAGLTAAQLDEDAPLEFCRFGGPAMGCLDGRTLATQWTLLYPSFITAARAGTVYEDFRTDLLIAIFERSVQAVIGETGAPRWGSPVIDGSGIINQLEFADFTGDALPEVVAGSMNWGDYSGLATLDAASGQLVAGFWHLPVFSTVVAPGPGSSSVLLAGLSNGAVVPVDPLTGLQGPSVTMLPYAAMAMGIADFNRDGVADLAAVTGLHVQVQDGKTGLPLWISPFLRLAENFILPRLPLLVGDLDGDSVPEILVATLDGIVHFEGPLLLVFADGFESGNTSNW